MAAEDDVLNFEVHNGVFNDGGGVDVGGGDDIGDVAVDENVAGLEAEEGGFGDARVGTAEPENSRRLPSSELREEVGVLVIFIACPCSIRAQGIAERILV